MGGSFHPTTWVDVVLAALNVVQVVALAYLTAHRINDERVKKGNGA